MNSIPIVDMHCDTLFETRKKQRLGQSFDMRTQDMQINFDKLKSTGYALQNFAIFVDLMDPRNPFEEALHMVNIFHEQLAANSDIISPVTSWQEIEANMQAGKMSAMLALEEGGIWRGELDFLQILYRLGARMMTLTWNYENEMAFPNFERKRNLDMSGYGLKEKGIQFLHEMERLGIIIDVSHLSDAGFYDVLRNTTKPFVASHSNARSVAGHMRNLTDDMIVQLANRGGITGINFCDWFLGEPPAGEDYIDMVVKQMQYLTNLGGEDFVGFGSDLDGIIPYDDIADCTYMEKIIHRMEKSGFSQTQIEKICYKNVLRIYKELLS